MTPRTRIYFRRRKYNKTNGLAPIKSIDLNTGKEVYYYVLGDDGCVYGSGIKPVLK